MKLDDLDDDALVAAVERLAQVRHDLGKYICFETRFLADDADDQALSQALQADLLATVKRGDQRETAWQLWARLRPADLADEPDILGIDAAIGRLERCDLGGTRAELDDARTLAREVAERSRRLHGRAVARRDEQGG